MNFCQECNNLLYPQEDRASKTLLYACRHCSHKEPAKNNCVYVNEIKQSASSQKVTTDMHLDPTLFRTKKIRCPKCQYNEAVYFTPSLETMALYFLCCNRECHHQWIQGAGSAAK